MPQLPSLRLGSSTHGQKQILPVVPGRVHGGAAAVGGRHVNRTGRVARWRHVLLRPDHRRLSEAGQDDRRNCSLKIRRAA